MRLISTIVALCAFCWSASSVQAGQLTTWQLSNDGRRLSFKTDEGVQPKAILLFAPTRLVIDLPGTRLSRPTVTQKLSGYYNTLRVGQFNDTTVRLVLEVRSGYTLDPKKISFTGYNPIDWAVDLPVPTVGATPNL